jgi:hypothetical protein
MLPRHLSPRFAWRLLSRWIGPNLIEFRAGRQPTVWLVGGEGALPFAAGAAANLSARALDTWLNGHLYTHRTGAGGL